MYICDMCEAHIKLMQNVECRMRLMETSCQARYLPLPDCRVVVVTILTATFAKR